MNQPIQTVLDNPIWHALTSTDADKNIGDKELAFFDAAMAPFIGMPNWDATSQEQFYQKADPTRSWFLLIADEVEWIPSWEIAFTIPLYQLQCKALTSWVNTKKQPVIQPLDERHVEEMIALTALTRPGPFTKRTIEFGNYHGIFEDGRLAAMGGERMHIGYLTEISAICTHPDFQGRGYGAAITHFLATAVFQKGETPFLHARVDNTKAIELYQQLGFEIRRTMAFYIIRQKPA